MSKKQIVILVVVAVVFAGGGFYAGMKYQQSKTPSRGNFAQFTGQGGAAGIAAQNGTRRIAGGQNGASFVSGTVLSKDSNSITVKNQSGGSQIVILGSSAQYQKSVQGTSDDVTVGENVTVTGTQNSDGSLTAQNVQIRNAPPSATSTPQ